jgi:hypothetical protein
MQGFHIHGILGIPPLRDYWLAPHETGTMCDLRSASHHMVGDVDMARLLFFCLADSPAPETQSDSVHQLGVRLVPLEIRVLALPTVESYHVGSVNAHPRQRRGWS